VPAPLDIDRNIRRAISSRRLIQVTYKERVRVGEPHDYGLINGELRLLVYQRREETTLRPPGWRLLTVSDITTLIVLRDTFDGPRALGAKQKFKWNPLICRVA
jgi:hypothetical protein